MGDEDDKAEKTPPRRPKQSTGEWTRELLTSTIGLVVSREEANDKKDDATIRRLWIIILALIGVLLVLVSGIVGVGVTGKVPGGYELTTVPTVERRNPGAILRNEAEELPAEVEP